MDSIYREKVFTCTYISIRPLLTISLDSCVVHDGAGWRSVSKYSKNFTARLCPIPEGLVQP